MTPSFCVLSVYCFLLSFWPRIGFQKITLDIVTQILHSKLISIFKNRVTNIVFFPVLLKTEEEIRTNFTGFKKLYSFVVC